jgi:hypothetical protein
MYKNIFLPAAILLVFFTGCSVSKNYNAGKKYSPQQLKQDYILLRNILEKKHPSLYWYTSKDSMDQFFDKGYQSITDSMTELQFGWNVLAPVINKIRCGHTSFGMSKNWYKFIEKKHIQIPSFPLYLKIWNDTMVVTANLNRKDSIIKKGTLITSINGMRNYDIIHQMFNYLSLDGYADNVNYIRISSNFPFYHRNVFGLFQNYSVGYIDSTGQEKYTLLHMFVPDSTKEKMDSTFKMLTRHQYHKQLIENFRSLSIDSSINTAVMTLNTFSKGGRRHLRTFFRRSFRKIKKDNIHNFVLDLRSNGGGDIGMFVLLTKYLRNTPFKASDSSFAIAKSLKPYTKYISGGFFDNLGLFFLTHKEKDGNRHYGYWERHLFHPKKSSHFNGKVYVLINGPTFSASTLFCNAVKGQSNIKLVGEETGGGWYGNNGIMIPDITLPITKLRVRLPVFRIVQYHHIDLKGTGVTPDVFIPPTVDGVRRSLDRKMLLVKEMIKKDITNN